MIELGQSDLLVRVFGRIHRRVIGKSPAFGIGFEDDGIVFWRVSIFAVQVPDVCILKVVNAEKVGVADGPQHALRGDEEVVYAEGEAVALKIIVLFLESHELGVEVPELFGGEEKHERVDRVELSRYVQEQFIL